jgi:rifamycin polyketide synthase module 1/2/3
MIQTDIIIPIGQLLERNKQVYGAKVAWRDVRQQISYSDLEAQTSRFAGHFLSLGITQGQSIAVYLPNSVPWIISALAIVRAGFVCVPIFYDASPAEVAYRISDAGCVAVITLTEKYESLQVIAGQESLTFKNILFGDDGLTNNTNIFSFQDMVTLEPAQNAQDQNDIDCLAFIVYTSGTTGKPKGVMLNVRSLLWVVGSCLIPVFGLHDKDDVISPLPLFHSYALAFSVLGILATGSSEYIMERYSSSELLKLIKDHDFTILPGVPTMFHYLLEGAKKESISSLKNIRLGLSAGAILPAKLNQEFEEYFGVKLLDGYGITETATFVTLNSPISTRIFGSCGVPIPGQAVRIVDPVSLQDIPAGQEGELIVRGPNLMMGYFNKVEETATALRNGWYHTGDLAIFDLNGFITITGRLKELIIRGGQNIAPIEIEEAIKLNPEVLDCAAVGLADKYLGEVPVIFVVRREGHSPTQETIIADCKKYLSDYKIPKHVYFVDIIPRTGSGKIMRFKLVEKMPT